MLVEHTITRLNDMRLAGMSEAYSWQREKPNIHELSFDERFGMLVDREWACRQDRRLTRLLSEPPDSLARNRRAISSEYAANSNGAAFSEFSH